MALERIDGVVEGERREVRVAKGLRFRYCDCIWEVSVGAVVIYMGRMKA